VVKELSSAERHSNIVIALTDISLLHSETTFALHAKRRLSFLAKVVVSEALAFLARNRTLKMFNSTDLFVRMFQGDVVPFFSSGVS
jgi:hypothetical protein